MNVTTSYGTWCNHAWDLTVEQTVENALGDHAFGFDCAAIVADYRAAVDEALPDGVALCGDEFFGPAYDEDCDFEGFPTDEFGGLDIGAIVRGIDLWEIVERHDLVAEALRLAEDAERIGELLVEDGSEGFVVAGACVGAVREAADAVVVLVGAGDDGEHARVRLAEAVDELRVRYAGFMTWLGYFE